MRLPTGIQDFTKLREEGYIYVDKTMFMQPFVAGGVYFLARPRRFGKSLLLSTLKAIFLGRKDLFKDLWLENNHDFAVHPIVRLDFSLLDFQARSLETSILESLRQTALEYDLELRQDTAKSVFEELIRGLSSRGKVVVLIDEYDKPITDHLLEPEKRLEHQNILKSVYGVLKPMDQYLHLVFLTGVSKIGKLSLFSDLNNLQDISLNNEFATICGYTRSEIEFAFPAFISKAVQTQQVQPEEFWERTKYWYNGYSWDAINRLYCPFSFLLFLSQPEFKSYWYETGTPTFLVQMIQNQKIDPLVFELSKVDESPLVATDVDNLDPIGLMFQTGYLTIIDKHNTLFGVEYELSYPNHEVRLAFSRSLLANYTKSVPSFISGFALDLRNALLKLEWQNFFERVNSVLAGVPYEIFPKKEAFMHSLLHLMVQSTGLRTQSQVQTSLGRMDMLVETLEYQLIFEFKIGGTPEAALEQINLNKYADMLLALSKPVVKIGVVFDLETKSITAWKVE